MSTLYQLLPDLAPDEYQELKADIRERGVLVPVEVDENGNILDGHHRARAWRELRVEGVNLPDYPTTVRAGMTEEQKVAHALTLNLARRHLTGEQRQALHVALRQRGLSYRQIAAQTNTPETTVRRDVSTAPFGAVQPERIVGADGKSRPATMPKPDPGPCLPEPDEVEEEDPFIPTPDEARERPDEDPFGMGHWPAEEMEAPRNEVEPAPATPASTMAVHFSSETPEHYTPDAVLAAAVECMGGIDLDPCADPGKRVPAQLHYTKDEDGLSREWHGRVYMNPPYGREIDAWATKLCAEHAAGRVVEAIALVPARTDTQWFRRFSEFYPWCGVQGRLTFIGNDGPAPFPSAIFYLGEDIGRFYRAFRSFGPIFQEVLPDNDGRCWPGRFAE